MVGGDVNHADHFSCRVRIEPDRGARHRAFAKRRTSCESTCCTVSRIGIRGKHTITASVRHDARQSSSHRFAYDYKREAGDSARAA